MAIQDIKRSSRQLVPSEDTDERIEQMAASYDQLQQEVLAVHNSFQNFTVAVAAVTTIAVTLAIPAKTVNYCVSADFPFTNAGYWTTGKSTTGFTLNWTTVGTGTIRLLVVE